MSFSCKAQSVLLQLKTPIAFAIFAGRQAGVRCLGPWQPAKNLTARRVRAWFGQCCHRVATAGISLGKRGFIPICRLSKSLLCDLQIFVFCLVWGDVGFFFLVSQNSGSRYRLNSDENQVLILPFPPPPGAKASPEHLPEKYCEPPMWRVAISPLKKKDFLTNQNGRKIQGNMGLCPLE